MFQNLISFKKIIEKLTKFGWASFQLIYILGTFKTSDFLTWKFEKFVKEIT